MAAYALSEKFKIDLLSKNKRTPYGELDLLFIERCSQTLLCVEVKMMRVEGCLSKVWSFSQRKRFRKSVLWICSQRNKRVESALCLIYPDEVIFLNLNDEA